MVGYEGESRLRKERRALFAGRLGVPQQAKESRIEGQKRVAAGPADHLDV